MSHANAALTPRQRLRLARRVVEEGWSISAAADYFRVSYPTAVKWARRFVELGPDGMADRSSRPHSHPNRTPHEVVKRIVRLRIRKRLGPVQIAGRLGLPASVICTHDSLILDRPRWLFDRRGAPVHAPLRLTTRSGRGDGRAEDDEPRLTIGDRAMLNA